MAFRLRTAALAAPLLVAPFDAWANFPLTAEPVTIDFSTFTGTGFAPAPALGQLDSDFWVVRGVSDGDLAFGGTGTMNDYAEGTSAGSVTEGGVFSFDVGAEFALGASPSTDDFTPGSFVLRLRNDTGQTIDDLTVAFDLWWINSGGRSMSFAFATSPDDSTYTNVGSFGFNTPQASDANGWQEVVNMTTLTGLGIDDGENLYLRFAFDVGGGGGEYDELGIGQIDLIVREICGNAIPEDGEECDDGNDANDDACVDGCIDATCGDGFVQGGVEGCDDGNANNTDACPDGAGGTCQDAECGDGFTQAGVEECDDANGSNTDACVGACLDASCGDGFVQGGVEGCDDGNATNTDACPDGAGGTCEDAVCGDGFTQEGVEECDDMNGNDADACANDCTANVETTESGSTSSSGGTEESTTTGGTTMSVDDTGSSTFDDTTTGSGSATTDTTTTGEDASASGSTAETLTSSGTVTGGSGSDTDTDSGGFQGEEPPGCGCRSGGEGWWLPALFGVFAIRRRRRARA